MVKDANLASPFIGLKVTDIEGKNFSLFVPKGRFKERGWHKMAEMVREMGVQTRSEPQKNNVTDIGE